MITSIPEAVEAKLKNGCSINQVEDWLDRIGAEFKKVLAKVLNQEDHDVLDELYRTTIQSVRVSMSQRIIQVLPCKREKFSLYISEVGKPHDRVLGDGIDGGKISRISGAE